MSTDKKIALFIDADNISAKYGKPIMENLQERGEIFIRRIYGNWEKNSLHKWNEVILKYGLLAVQQMDFVTGKNATDMSLTIDAMEVLYRNQADIFVIVSGDSDFTPLAVKLRERGTYVICMGSEKTSSSFRSACNEFIDLDAYAEKIEPVEVDKIRPVVRTRSTTKKVVNKESRVGRKVSSSTSKRSSVVKISDDEKINISPKIPAPTSKVVQNKGKRLTLNDRFVMCGQNGMRNPKKKLMQIHEVLHESAKKHSDSNGFAPLNLAGIDLNRKRLGYGIKDFGYSLLREFIGDFPDLYELTKGSGKTFRYRCLK